MTKYVIVKYPDLIDFKDGPCKVHASFSCHATYSGRECDIKPIYADRSEAERDLDKLQSFNTGVEYGIFETLE